MEARNIGELIGFVAAQMLIFALIIGAIVYFVKGRKQGFFKTVLNWKVLLPALLLVVLINLSKFAGTASSGESFSAFQLQEIKAGCVESGNGKGQPADKVNLVCDCFVEQVQRAYPSFKEAKAAMSSDKGMPEALKPGMLVCAQKAFGAPAAESAAATPPAADAATPQWAANDLSTYTNACKSSFKANGASDKQVEIACGCIAEEAQKLYPTYAAAEAAYTDAKGAPEALKPRMMACMQKAQS